MVRHFAAPMTALILLAATAAQASPVQFTYTGVIGSATTPGVSSGDTYTIRLLADNGSNSLANQSWSYSDLQGFTIDAGSYHASYSKVWESSSGFTTDAGGNITSVAFYGTSDSSNNTDNFGSWTGDYVYGDGAFIDFLGNYNSISTGLQDTSRWSVAAVTTPAPEPASWAMMLGGFGMIGSALRARRKSMVSFA
jgi:hypothetical protein